MVVCALLGCSVGVEGCAGDRAGRTGEYGNVGVGFWGPGDRCDGIGSACADWGWFVWAGEEVGLGGSRRVLDVVIVCGIFVGISCDGDFIDCLCC